MTRKCPFRISISFLIRTLLPLLFVLPALLPPSATSGEPLLQRIIAPLKRHGREPESCADPAIETLAQNLDWLEHELDRWGTVVAKSPDIWGEARLTKYRREVEEQLGKEIGKFNKNQINGTQFISDSAFLAAAVSLNLQPTLTGGRTTRVPAPPTSISIANSTTAGVAGGTPTTSLAFDTTQPGQLFGLTGDKITLGGEGGNIQLEQVEQIDQLKRYLDHLNELRRINQGDDTSDAPGYSLNLIRIPVSILPGARSREGYGAEITMTAQMVMEEQMLPSTYREFVINDLVDQIAVPLTQFLNQDPDRAQRLLDVYEVQRDKPAALRNLNNLLHQNGGRLIQSPEVRDFIEQQQRPFHYYDVALGGFGMVTLDESSLADLHADLISIQDIINLANKQIEALPERLHNELSQQVASNTAVMRSRQAPHATSGAPKDATQFESIPVPLSDNTHNTRRFMQTFNIPLPDSITKYSETVSDSNVSSFANSDIVPAIPTADAIRQSLSVSTAVAIHRNTIDIDAANKALADISPFLTATENLDISIESLMGGATVPSSSTRRATLPFPPRHLPDNFGYYNLGDIALVAHQAFENEIINRQVIHLTDLQSFLREELSAAYNLLSQPEMASVWLDAEATPAALVSAIRLRQADIVEQLERDFKTRISTGVADRATPALAWCVYVESMLLNDQFNQAVTETLGQDRCTGASTAFYGPNPSPEARELFANFVSARWPLRIFTIDPVVTEQNIADVSSVYRQMQLAVAIAFSSGEIGASAAMQTLRKVQRDIATIDLNRTVVGFCHGQDTFGWRFYPRFQAPPVEGNATVSFRDLIVGGPTDKQLLRSKQLEPGMRECVAIVMMPSFVSKATIETRGNWFRLDHANHTALSNQETVQYSRAVEAMRHTAQACVRHPEWYRNGEVSRLLTRVDQLDRELPLQTLSCPIPIENTLGGFEILSAGTRELAPELLGWYGAPGYDPAKGAHFFIAGDNFSVSETQLIAGNQVVADASLTMLSRQVLEVKLEPNLPIIKDSRIRHLPSDNGSPYNGFLDLHLATPYGVSGHLLIPAIKPPAAAAPTSSGPALSKNPVAMKLTVKASGKPTAYSVVGLTPQTLPLARISAAGNSGISGPAKITLRFSTDDGSLLPVAFADVRPQPDGSYTIDGGQVLDATGGPKGGLLESLGDYGIWYLATHDAPEHPLAINMVADIAIDGGPTLHASGTSQLLLTLVTQP